MKISFIIPMYIQSVKYGYTPIFNYWNLVGTEHEVIIVDDGSPKHLTKDLPSLYKNINFERIDEDIPWNQPAARNFGAAIASNDVLIFTDFDHIFEVENSYFDMVSKYFKYDHNTTKTYMFPRIKNGENINPHPCTFAILRDNFRGFDESYCGNYGYDDMEFLNRHKPNALFTQLKTKVVLHESTHDLERNTNVNLNKL